MRKAYLDNIRWMTVLLVVVYHVFFIFSAVTPGMGLPFTKHQTQDGVLYVLYPWMMVLLFIVSGMSSRYFLESHTVRAYVRARTRKLLVPSTVGLLVAGWIQGFINMSIAGALKPMLSAAPLPVRYLILVVSGTGVFWFIQMLWLFSMVLALIRRFETGRLYALTEKTKVPALLLLGIPVWLSGQVLNPPVVSVYRFGIYGFVFFLGYFVFAHDAVIENLSRSRYFLIALAAVFGIFHVHFAIGRPYAVMPEVNAVSAVAYLWSTVLAIFGAGRAWGNRFDKVCRFFNRHSFGIYVCHYLVLSAAALGLRTHTALPALPCYLITAAAAFGGSLAMSAVIAKIPFLRWALLGLKKEKKHV
ncbi:MAG: acyltransferase family protein [Pseudoramibacter sp.]